MNIVFILGNGFDLQLGLPTRYSDFYQYYVGLDSKSNSVRKLKSSIKEGAQDWSDLEVALGDYTSQTNSIEEFTDAYDDLQIALRDYMLKVDEMLKSGELLINTKAESLVEGLLYPERFFDSDARYTIEGDLMENSHTPNLEDLPCNVNLITFNYTHLVENFTKTPNKNYPRRLINTYHIHREINEQQSIWLGVDNKTQIKNESFQNSQDVLYRIIKPLITYLSNKRLVERCKQLIKNSDVIIIFGASLGPSDETWAKMIAERIKMGNIVLLFEHNNKSYITDNAKLVDKMKYLENFVSKLNGYGSHINDASNIYIEINSSIFTDGTANNHDKNHNLVLEKLKNDKQKDKLPLT